MKFRSVLHLISYLLVFTGFALWVSAWVGWLMGDAAAAVLALGYSGGIGVLVGLGLAIATRGTVRLSRRDGFGIVAFGWLAVALVGMLPYLFAGIVPDVASALFETVSGFTTTGASVLTDLEQLPRGILFWRAMTQWLGGMGVLVLCVAILPFLGVGGMQIYQAEMPGPSKDRLTPRIASTAKLLWGLYVLLTLVQSLLLVLGGMSLYESFCHAFTTMSTGGFSTRTASIAAFDSAYVDWIVITFMFLAGANFSLHYRTIMGNWRVFGRNPEFRFYAALWGAGGLLVTLVVWYSGLVENGGAALRHGFFQVTSILTTTGYATRDFDLWPLATRFLLVFLMFVGGCGGSTAGGMKAIRVFVVLKHVLRALRRAMLPQSVARIKLGTSVLEESVVTNIVSFCLLFGVLFVMMSFAMSFCMPDLVTATSAVVACLGNIGPGLGAVGPTETYAFVPGAGKLVLTFAMLLGRLELYTVILLFLPAFWRK